jgi:hypothetical protein
LPSRTAADTWALRSLTAPAAGLTINNPAGVAGDPTFALANDLAALEALSGTHTIYYRSATDTWTAVTIGTGLDFTGANAHCTVSAYTDEQAQDAVGNILTDTARSTSPITTARNDHGNRDRGQHRADAACRTPRSSLAPTATPRMSGSSRSIRMAGSRSRRTSLRRGGSGSWIPLVTGAEPPVLVSDGAGVLILVAA